MSNLRLFGMIIGILGIIFTFLKYRGPKWKRFNFISFIFFNVCLIVVCIDPNVVNIARDMLSLQEYQYGRLIALLIISNVFLLIFSLFSKAGQDSLRLQLDRLVRSLGATDLMERVDIEEEARPIMVVIPAYNESENLRELLPKIPAQIRDMEVGVLVIDDGSEDETVQTVRDLGHLVVTNLVNRGGGAALRLGYDVIKKSGSQICVTMDADGQHQPEEIEKLVFPILNDQNEFVIGSRILGTREKDRLFRIIGVYFFGLLISFLLGKRITDPSSGFRAFKMDAMASIELYEDQYHTSELIIEAVKKGIRIGEVPITILKRKHGRSKKGRDWIYGFHFARIIIKTWWRPK
jgi:GT2 family glycosyltransferase